MLTIDSITIANHEAWSAVVGKRFNDVLCGPNRTAADIVPEWQKAAGGKLFCPVLSAHFRAAESKERSLRTWLEHVLKTIHT